jgi:hypothetical protein
MNTSGLDENPATNKVQLVVTIPLALLSGYGYIAIVDLHNGRLESKSWKKLLTVVSVGPL